MDLLWILLLWILKVDIDFDTVKIFSCFGATYSTYIDHLNVTFPTSLF